MAYFTWDMVGANAIVRGDDFSLSLTWETGDPSLPVNLTGWSGTFQVLGHYQNPAPYLSVPVTGLDATGSVLVTVPRASILAVLPRAALVYQVVLIDPGGLTHTLVRGRADVL